ncbi:MAG: GH25 family lysozyme, partial [Calditrichota bacterium]
RQNWKAVKDAGMVLGAYHFYRPERDAIQQADNFINTVVLDSRDLPPVLDVELKYNVSKRDIRQDVLIWLKHVEAAYNRKPILYTDSSFVNLNLANEFTNYPLWIAEYADSVSGSLAGWDKWTFWQYTNSGEVKGVAGPVDRNVFRGTLTEWEELVGGSK